MNDILMFFPIILYLLGAVLLVVLIILGTKLIYTVNKANEILDDAYNKSKSLNVFFDTIDKVTDTLSNFSDSIVSNVTGIIGKVLSKKRKNEKENDDNE